MTPPKEALELKPCPFCGKPPILLATHETDNYIREYEIRCDNCGIGMSEEYESSAAELWNTRALASLQGEDAVERVAQALLDRFIERSKCRSLSGKPTFRDGTKITELPASYRDDFEADARAILAAGLVPDEAAIRADWHTTGWDRARNSGRILLVWREFAGVREHVELGRYSDSKTAWVNTYGHQFHAEPDGWAPLLPFKTAEAIRADERERCAKVADGIMYPDFEKSSDIEKQAYDIRCSIAAAIRSGGGE